MSSSVQVFTFKSGLLSRLAHDLRLRCESWRIEVDHGRVSATFDPRTLRVDGVMRGGTLDPRGLSAGDFRKIEATVREDILGTHRHPEVTFDGKLHASGSGVDVEGDLTLAGRTSATPKIRARRQGDRWTAEVELQPSRWGVAPYRALGGALKLQDRVIVRVTLPAVEGVGPGEGAHVFAP